MRHLVCLALCIGLLPLAAVAKQRVHRVLPNGLTVVVQEDHARPVVALQAWVKTGSALEGRHIGSGLSHYYEHMLFKGTRRLKVGEFSARIRAAGGADLNAYTTTSHTVYHFTILARHFEAGLADLAEILTAATFPAAEVKQEMPVILREMDQAADDAGKAQWRSLMETLYRVHPYRHPVIGHKQLFEGLSREAILDYYKSRYSPANIVFVVVGDVDAEQAAARVAKAFAGQRRRPLAPVYVPREPEPVAARRFERRFHVERTRLVVAWKTVGARHPDMPALDLLAAVLGMGDSSRLARTLKEDKQLVTETSAWSWTPRWAGALAVDAKLEDRQLAAVEQQIEGAIKAVRDKLVDEAELVRARNKLLADLVLTNQSPADQARQLGWALVVGGELEFHEAYARRLQQTTREELRDVARRYLLPRRKVTVVLRPRQAAGAANKKGPAPVVTPPALHTLPNGLRIVLRENHGVPAVHLHARGLGGALFEPALQAGVANLMAELLIRGTQKRTARQIADRIETVGGRIAGSGGNNTYGVTLDLLAKDLELGLELLADVLRNPSFPAAELARLRKQVLARIAAQQVDPWSINDRLLREALFAGHPYSRSHLGTRAGVSKLQQADVQAAWKQLVAPKNLVLAVYGDFDSKAVLARLAKLFGDWQGPTAPDAERFRTPVRDEPVVRRQADARFRQTVIRLGFPAVRSSEADRIPLEALAKVLGGMGSRLFLELRDRQSLAYSVGCYSAAHFAAGSFVFYIGTTADKERQALAGLVQQIERIKTTLTAAELDRARQALVGQRVTQDGTNAAQALTAVLHVLYGEGLDADARDAARIEKLTVEELQRVARKYFDPRRMVTAIVTPGKAAGATSAKDPQRTPAGAVARAIELLEAGQHRELLEQFIHPEQKAQLLAKSTLDELAARFAQKKAARLLAALKQVRESKPRLSKDGMRATYQTGDGRDVALGKVGQRWYLLN